MRTTLALTGAIAAVLLAQAGAALSNPAAEIANHHGQDAAPRMVDTAAHKALKRGEEEDDWEGEEEGSWGGKEEGSWGGEEGSWGGAEKGGWNNKEKDKWIREKLGHRVDISHTITLTKTHWVIERPTPSPFLTTDAITDVNPIPISTAVFEPVYDKKDKKKKKKKHHLTPVGGSYTTYYD